MATGAPSPDRALRDKIFALLESVPDPEIPVVSIRELGILRDVIVDGGEIEVIITPTYSGCPAMGVIEEDVRTALKSAGIINANVRMVLSPAWTTDWMTPDAHRKLREYGIAPPGPVQRDANGQQEVKIAFIRSQNSVNPACPQCGSIHTERLSEFGSTSCKALYRCTSCREPFDYFKPY